MNIKLVALDMDGTTLDNNHFTISAKNRKAITDAIAKGIYVVPATGRTFGELPKSVRKIDGIRFVITSNGASTAQLTTKKEVYSNLIPLAPAINVLSIIKECKVYTEVYYNGTSYTQRGIKSNILRHNPFFMLYSAILKNVQVNNLAEFVSENGKPIEKIEIIPDNVSQKEMLEKKLNGIPLSITTSGMNTIEITNLGTSKGEALAYLCKYLHIDSDQVMAIGDNINDLEMLKWAGFAVDVDNADPAVKNVADFVTLSNSKSGVAHAIESFALNQR